jgi:Hsp20/alpha crystallin family
VQNAYRPWVNSFEILARRLTLTYPKCVWRFTRWNLGVSVEIADDAVTIQGERRIEREDDRDGYFRSERSYGSFCRVIPLPEGAMTEQAKATFHDGVLEVTLPAPPQATKSRKLEITDAGKK